MSNEKKTSNKNRRVQRSVGNKPFEDKLSPLLTTDIDKRINDLFSQTDRIIRTENSEFKKEVDKKIYRIDNGALDVNLKLSSIEAKLDKLEDKSNIENLKETLETQKDAIIALKKKITSLEKKCVPSLEVKINESKPIEVGIVHCQFEGLFKIVSTGLNVYLTGPAGSGKTTAAKKCADALGVDFYFTGAIASEFKLTGFIDAYGKIVSTEFRKAYEDGGLFLFDEIDGSFPQAVLAFNAALANDYMDFPDKRVKRHKNFYCIAAANTYGQGADRQYVGRNQLDAASIDRFVFVDWKYDEKLERKLSNNDKWVDYVQAVRRIIKNKDIRHIISPRASIYGAKLLKKRISRQTVEDAILWKGLDDSTIQLIKSSIKK